MLADANFIRKSGNNIFCVGCIGKNCTRQSICMAALMHYDEDIELPIPENKESMRWSFFGAPLAS